jgi:hypothetical protein
LRDDRPVGLTRLAGRISPDGRAMLVIAGVVILANLPYLVGVFDPNPLGPRGSLVSSAAAGPVGGQPTIDPNNGFVSQALGHRAALDLSHLHLPWWNPYEGSGAPLAAEMQSAAFFPPTLLTAVDNGQIYERVILELVAGVATYLVLRRLRLARWAAVAGGIAFGLNGTFAWFSHAPVNPVPLLPLLVLGIEHAYDAARARRHGGWWLIAVSGALSVYAGFPETAYINAVFAVFWFVWRLACLGAPGRGSLLIKGALGAVVGALLCAPLGLAAIEYFNHGDLSNHATTLYGSAHVPANGLPQLLMPYVYGPILEFAGPRDQLLGVWVVVGGYLSTSLLLLAGLGLISRGRRGLRVALGIWLLLAFARMYGQIPLLGHVFGWLPGMARIAFFRYGTPALEFGIVVLAALGVDELIRVPERRRRALWGAVAMLVVIGVAAAGARSLADQLGSKYSSRHWFEVAVAWGALIAIAVAVISARWTGRRRGALLCAVVAIDALVLFAAPELSAPRSVTVDAAPATYLSRHLGEGRFFTLGPLQPNYGSYFGVAEANINDLPIPTLYANYIHARLDQYVNPTVFVGNLGGLRGIFVPSPAQELLRNLNAYRAAGISYILTPVGQDLGSGRGTFTLVDRTPTTNIYRLAGAARYFSAAGCTVRSHDRQSATVTCPSASTLVRLETDLPGWSASVGSHSAAIHRVDGLFQAVRVPPGTSTVHFGYAPPNQVWGWVAFTLGVLALGGAALRRSRAPAARRASGAAVERDEPTAPEAGG